MSTDDGVVTVTKAEARRARRKELEKNGIKLGLRTPKSAKEKHSEKDLLQGICMTCKKRAYECECSGHMSREAHERFRREQSR